MKNVGNIIIVQARQTSKRFPNKVLKKIGGRSICEIILNFDEQIQVSKILRLMNGEAFFFYFDYARYYGILHGFLAIPLFWLLGG